MKIVSVAIDPIRADTSVAEFVVRVGLDGPATGCDVRGRVVGPRCEGISTVEVAYPLTLVRVSEATVRLKCVIPEPNLWTQTAPFTYATSVEVWVSGERTDTRVGVVALRGG